MEEVRFKEDRCGACRAELRKEIITEIHEDAGCQKCSRLFHALREQEKRPLVYRDHGKLKASRRKKL